LSFDILRHVEKWLGPMGPAQHKVHDSRVLTARFPNKPVAGVDTQVTLGLSNQELTQASGRGIRQELVVSARSSYDPGKVASFLVTLAEWVSRRKRALQRGEVIGPQGPVIPGVKANAVYVAQPAHLPPELSVYQEDGWTVVIAWVLPIVAIEAAFVRSHGWRAFEERLETIDAELWDLDRAPLVDRRRSHIDA